MILALLDRAARWAPEEVVGIARGGIVPASMAAGVLALPLTLVSFQRPARTIRWLGDQPAGRRLLLVDDCCSSGSTLASVRAVLCAEGRECLTLAVVYDPEETKFRPDLSHPMSELFRLPWERGEATPTARNERQQGYRANTRLEAPFHALCFDPAILSSPPFPYFDPQRAVLISGHLESYRAGIMKSLASGPYNGLPVECYPYDDDPDNHAITVFKAKAATRWGCTHLVESDAERAIQIAALAPHLIVSWWSPDRGQAWIVGAANSSKHADEES